MNVTTIFGGMNNSKFKKIFLATVRMFNTVWMIFPALDVSFTQVTRKIASGLSNLSYPENRQNYVAC